MDFAGKQILGLDKPSDEATKIQFDNEHKTLVFNAFACFQIFNQLDARFLDCFFDILKNYYFVVIFLIMTDVLWRASLLHSKVCEYELCTY